MQNNCLNFVGNNSSYEMFCRGEIRKWLIIVFASLFLYVQITFLHYTILKIQSGDLTNRDKSIGARQKRGVEFCLGIKSVELNCESIFLNNSESIIRAKGWKPLKRYSEAALEELTSDCLRFNREFHFADGPL